MDVCNACVPTEAQARAHAELDAFVGRSRLPTFADLPYLPYIPAIVKETLRWRPISPSSPPHQTTEDDWYEGAFIPKGTVCIANLWHKNRDPRSRKGAKSASVATWPTRRSSSTLQSCCGRLKLCERKTYLATSFLLDLDRWVNVGLVVLVVSITYHHEHANLCGLQTPGPVRDRNSSTLPGGSAMLAQEREMRGS